MVLINVLVLLVGSCLCADPSQHITATFRTPDSTSLLQHLLLSPNGDNVYLGATNNLYQLDEDLKLKSSFKTGPELDSHYCNWNAKDCIRPRHPLQTLNAQQNSKERERMEIDATKLKSTNNFNQVLVYYPLAKLVVSCGTVHQGICSLHKAEDISKTVPQTVSPTPVAANSANATTVAFIGPGPDAKDVLYVGATFTHEHYRGEFPAVCTRSMDPSNLFHIASESIAGQSGRVIKTEYLSDFRVLYVGGFYSDGFAYWAAAQRKDPTEHKAPFESKLLRVCAGDREYKSYSELPLECLGPDNSNYNIIKSIHIAKLGSEVISSVSPEYLANGDKSNTQFLVAVFGRGESPSKMQPLRSAVCVYPLSEIRSAFFYNIQRCRSGVGYWNLPHYGQNQRCSNMSHIPAHPSDDCILGLVGGVIPASKPAALSIEDAILTGVTSSIVGNSTVLFLATDDGRVKKAVLNSVSRGRVYSEVQISASRSPIGSDILLDSRKEHVLALSGNQLIKMKVSACDIHKDCATCVQSGDPYCGWCTLNNECSPKSHCPWTSYENGWLPSSLDALAVDHICPRLLQPLHPRNSSINDDGSSVRIVLNALPPPPSNGVYDCVYGDVHHVNAKYITPNTLICPLPPVNVRPDIGGDMDHVTLPLSIWSSASGKSFFDTEYLFYDCAQHNLCTSCVGSRWRCEWCLSDNACVSSENQCSNQVHIIKSHASSPARVHESADGENECPHIDKSSLEQRILLPSGHSTPIKLPVLNVQRLVGTAEGFGKFECSLLVEGKYQKVGASLDSDGFVSCDEFPFSYSTNEPTMDAELFLTTGNNIVIDKTTVTLYKCELLSNDCSRCLTLDPQYMCSWCGGRCQFRNFCPIGTLPNFKETASTVCPAPVIQSISPSSGPVEGGTRVVIRGRDLGTRREDVDQRVFIGDIPCNVTDYEVSVRIECITSSSGSEKSGQVRITLGPDNRRTVTSANSFLYVNPTLYKFSPTKGPISGGTEVTISGTLLNTGNEQKVWLGTIPCKVIKHRSTEDIIVCETKPSLNPGFTITELRVQFDNAERRFRHIFEYVPDPEIENIYPMESFVSGGRSITVRGTNLNATSSPKIFLIDPIQMRKLEDVIEETVDSDLPPLASTIEDCVVLNSTTMVCPSPALLKVAFRLKRTVKRGDRESLLDRYPQWPVGFLMDGVEKVRTLGITQPNFAMRVVPDPHIQPFTGGVKLYRNVGDPVVFDANQLSLAATQDDVKIFVGSEVCNISLLSDTQLVCDPPFNMQSAVSSVVVTIGNRQYELGDLVYNSGGMDRTLSNPALVGGVIGAASLMLLVFVLAIAVWWRRKSCQAEKEYKRIQMQMDHLESNVRQECKQAFAELQTDMCDLTNDHVSLGIPFHSPRVFAAKMLFKDEFQQSLLTNGDWTHTNGCNTQLQAAVAQFEALLWNRQFVVHMVETLERQPSFTAQDRVYVASLLTASLARNMQYNTDVTLHLLKMLIKKSVDSKYPQLMLRRTESVVEKMLANWMALCLHDFLYSESGGSLFLLFMALKHQVEKGPVDAVTGEARYSLSEDRLLKEQLKHENLVLHVLPPIETDVDEAIVCRVLSCDTITQAKNKVLDTVYRNTPFSLRPTVHELDLEWRRTPSCSVILSDDDKSGSNARDDFRRLNTVQSYGIHNDAFMALLPTRPGSFNYTMSHTYASINSSTHLIPNGHHSPESTDNHTIKYWHLSRPQAMINSPYTIRRNGSMHKNSEYRDYRTSPTATMHKNMPEIYLTRLLTSKGTVQKFVDDFFSCALRVDPRRFPPVIKYLFDFLEEEAAKLQISDPSVVQAWKNNSLPLRFWVNVIKNPDFVFDIEKSSTVDACLSVVAATFMDACSPSEVRLGKDSPSNKLLFAKDMSKYRSNVSDFYKGVQSLPPVSEQDLGTHMAHLSKVYGNEFSVVTCVRELLGYVLKYDEAMLAGLYADPSPQGARLAQKLSNVLATATGQLPVENEYAAVR